MTEYTVSKIASIINGRIILNETSPEISIQYISTDSRTVIDGFKTLFFALTGPRNNGHNYLEELFGKGIRVFVISEIPQDRGQFPGAAFIKVENTLEALQKLAAWHRRQFSYPVVGITGSNGKTIIKEWLYDLLSPLFSVVRSPKSYNSQVGAPLSVWLMNENSDFALFEAGISKPGEMEKLQPIIRPEIGIFTNIGMAHQENFAGFTQKTSEKLRLFSQAKKLIFSADQNEISQQISDFCFSQNIEPVIWSAQGNKALINFEISVENQSAAIKASVRGKVYPFSIPFNDQSALENACHCFAAVIALGLDPEPVLAGFSKLAAVAMRLEIKQGINDCMLINDYYNSDINSLSIALSVLENHARIGNLGKTVILSDIKQSGIVQEELCAKVNEMLKNAGVDELIAIGPGLAANQKIFGIKSLFYFSTDDFLNGFKKDTLNNSVVLIKGARDFNFERISGFLQEKAHQTVLEINLTAMVHNLNTFKSMLKPATKIVAMVKAFSYGSGTVEIAKMLQYHQIDYLAVAVADEGVELRKAGVTVPIIVMNPEQHSFQHLIDYRLEPNIYSLPLLSDFAKTVHLNAEINFPVHLKLDTGMNRLGFKTIGELAEVVEFMKAKNSLKVKSIFSHLAGSDDPVFDLFTREQLQKFSELSNFVISSLGYDADRHILNSAGIERFPENQYEMARLGIGLYGVSCCGNDLKNISTLKTIISQIKKVEPGETVGYSRKGKVTRPSKIAVIPIGYADGLRRSLGNLNGRVCLNGHFAPIIGNICMDMCMIDISGIEACVGDEVEIFGEHISITELAGKCGTIPYEILTGISQRVKRIYLQE